MQHYMEKKEELRDYLIKLINYLQIKSKEYFFKKTILLLVFFRPFMDASSERDNDFTDHIYQENLHYFQRSHTSKSIKDNLKISELFTDPSYAYQTQRVCFICT